MAHDHGPIPKVFFAFGALQLFLVLHVQVLDLSDLGCVGRGTSESVGGGGVDGSGAGDWLLGGLEGVLLLDGVFLQGILKTLVVLVYLLALGALHVLGLS